MAKKNVSLLVSAAGWLGGFVGELIPAMRERGISDEEIHAFVNTGSKVSVGIIADGLVGAIRQAKNIFHIMVGGRMTTEQVVETGKYDWVNSNINSRNFPMRPRPAGQQVVIELLEFDYDPSTEQVLKEARKRGLERPVYEDALFFGEQFPEEQRKYPVVFLHEDPYGRLGVIVLYGNSSKRHLNLNNFRRSWGRRCRFAFVRK
jgi:hypothetical protein